MKTKKNATEAMSEERLAELKGIAPEECARATLENGCRFFGISADEIT